MSEDPWQPPTAPIVAGPRLPDSSRTQLFRLIWGPVLVHAEAVAATDAVLAAGWRPPPKRVRSVGEVDELPRGSILQCLNGSVYVVGQPRTGRALIGALIVWVPS